MYSKEEGTPAAKLPDQIHPATKKKRYNKLMKLAQEISEENMSNRVGSTYRVLIETKTSDMEYYIGRTYMDIPDQDGVVFIKNTEAGLEEKFVDCKIIDYKDYDLIAEMV